MFPSSPTSLTLPSKVRKQSVYLESKRMQKTLSVMETLGRNGSNTKRKQDERNERNQEMVYTTEYY